METNSFDLSEQKPINNSDNVSKRLNNDDSNRLTEAYQKSKSTGIISIVSFLLFMITIPLVLVNSITQGDLLLSIFTFLFSSALFALSLAKLILGIQASKQLLDIDDKDTNYRYNMYAGLFFAFSIFSLLGTVIVAFTIKNRISILNRADINK